MSDLKVDGITAATANTAVTIKGLGTGKVVLGDGNLVFPDADGAAGTFITTNGSAALSFATAGKVVQVVNTQSGAVATGTTVGVLDDTIPTNTECNSFGGVLDTTITPTSASNILRIEVVLQVSHSAGSGKYVSALYQDSGAAISAETKQIAGVAGGAHFPGRIVHYMSAGTTSSTTFKVRSSAIAAGTTTLNGSSGSRIFGGVLISSMTITEYLP